MATDTIVEIKAREILDSKARPLVEVDVVTAAGAIGRGSAPCGTSTGAHEAVVLRDGGKRYGGLGVLRAVRNVLEVIAPALKGRDAANQAELDGLLNELDGTPDKSRLGANAVYSVSIAVARAAAASLGVPLYRHLGGAEACCLPAPMFNVINGGRFPSAQLEFQEFHLIPATAKRYSEALQMAVEIYRVLAETIRRNYGEDRLYAGASAGYGVPASDPAEVIDLLLEAVDAAGYAGQCRIGLDCAASEFYDGHAARYHLCGQTLRREELVDMLAGLARTYNLFMLEDPLHEDDFEGFAEITRRIPAIIAGDDLFVTNLERVKRGVALGAANAMILKPNMVGTISEALAAARFARENGYHVIGSGRAGGTIDDPITDIALAASARLVKFGAPRTGERLAKHNYMLRLEAELGPQARFAGPEIFTLPVPRAEKR
jgi:enolase